MSELINFRTEYQQRPLAVQSRTPHFSWQYEKSFRGEQASYRIRVATSEKLLYEGSEDMWDSGEVRSAASVGVQYGGRPLCSHSRYFVCCETTDGEGNRYRSQIASFETALYEKSDWKGHWVSVPVNFNGGTLLFRKAIALKDKKIARARA